MKYNDDFTINKSLLSYLKENVTIKVQYKIENELLLSSFDEICDVSQKGSYNGSLLSYLLNNNI